LWALDLPGVRQVEARVDRDMPESQRVAANAGFHQTGTVSQYVPGTGETYEDLRFVLNHSDNPAERERHR
jgi:RimJ/RimL family protein N-acetyltransferase